MQNICNICSKKTDIIVCKVCQKKVCDNCVNVTTDNKFINSTCLCGKTKDNINTYISKIYIKKLVRFILKGKTKVKV